MSIISWLIGRVTGLILDLPRSEYHPPWLPQLLALQPAILLAFVKNFISNIFYLTCSGLLLGRSKVWTYKDQNILAHPDQDIKRWACLSSGPFHPAILLAFITNCRQFCTAFLELIHITGLFWTLFVCFGPAQFKILSAWPASVLGPSACHFASVCNELQAILHGFP